MSAWIKIKECGNRGGVLGGKAAKSQGFKIHCALQNETMYVRYATISNSLKTYNFVVITISFQVSIKISRYRSGTVNSNTVNSKFHLIQSFFEIFARFLSFHV